MNNRIDKVLSASALRQVQEINDSLPPNEELLELAPSKEFEQKMQIIISEGVKKQQKHRVKRQIEIVAASILIVFTLSSSIFFIADASPANIIHLFDRYFAYNSGNVNEWDSQFNAQVIQNVHDVYLPTWVPHGFKALESQQGKNICVITYRNDNKIIRFIQSMDSGKLFSDNELKQMTRLNIKGQTYYYGEKGTDNSISRKLFWNSGKRTFEFISNASKDDMLKIVQSLKYKEG